MGSTCFLYGRPEGMTIEHCVLSAAFDREPTTCRDLCVAKHTNVELTDPTGYTFPVATDSACRNRLLHSRPVDGSRVSARGSGAAGIRGYQLVFNVPGEDDRRRSSRGYRAMLDALSAGHGAGHGADAPSAAGRRSRAGTSLARSSDAGRGVSMTVCHANRGTLSP